MTLYNIWDMQNGVKMGDHEDEQMSLILCSMFPEYQRIEIKEGFHGYKQDDRYQYKGIS